MSINRKIYPVVRAAQQPATVTRRVGRELTGRVADVQMDGLVAATRVEAASFVAQIGMHHLGLISETEARLIRRSPLGAERYQLVADSLAGVVANELDGLSVKWRHGR